MKDDPVHPIAGPHALDGGVVPDAPSQVDFKIACASCKLRELCLTGVMTDSDLEELDEIVTDRRRVVRGETLFARGDHFDALYAVRTGFFKTRIGSSDGRDQVTGFQMAGELLGLDGVADDEHEVDAIALEDSEVCVLPYRDLERIARDSKALQRQLHRVMSREIVREHGVMLLLGNMKADERIAAFLLNLSRRFQARGYAATEFQLRATREELGSYLGLKLETVSRAFSRLQDAGLIEVAGRAVRLQDLEALGAMVTAAGDGRRV